MDQLPRNNDGYNSLFPDSQQYHAYDNNFLNGTDQAFNDAGWGVNAGNNYPNTSRAQPALPQSWQQNANHLSTTTAHGNITGQASPSAYGRSLSHSPAPFAQNPYGGFGNQQNFQYRQPQYDPALFNPSTSGQDFNSSYATYGTQAQTLGTIAPQALEHEARTPTASANAYDGMNYNQNAFGQARFAKPTGSANIDQHVLVAAIPKGNDGGYLSVINFDQMVRATNSERMSNYLNIGKQAQEWPVNRTTALPQYVPRRSKNELRKLAGNDAVLLAKIGKKSMKKEKFLASGPTAAQFLGIVKGPGSPQIKYEGESSSSEESSDDDDDSSYTSEEELEGSPLPSKRPDLPKEAVEYDTIKALWRPKRKTVESASLKKGIVDFWEIVKTIRDRWRIDAAAVTEAEVKKRVGELPLLKSRVKDQRDMIESAFRAALKHGHRSIVELLAENPSLVFLCYQFLLDRFKDDDLNGPLPRVILELMTLFTTLSTETLEKTHLDKVLPRFVKKGDAKTQFYAKRITSNAINASREKALGPPPSKPITSSKAANAASPTIKRPEPEQVAGIKRSASNAGDGGAQKKVATGVAKTNGVSSVAKPNGVIKRPTTTSDASKAAATTAVPATKTKQVTAKPSSFFSSLQSAAKKPGTSIKAGTPVQATGTKLPERKAAQRTTATPVIGAKPTFSFAETMANLAKPKEQKPAAKPEKELPPETAEQKVKRLRKEARRKLHVAFKLGEDLVEVRYFTHDPDEEMGHDDSQMRDVSDAGGEGRALKLHHDMMDVDEEDDGEEQEQKLIEFKQPTAIDFSDVKAEERERNYSKYGGGELVPDSAERAAREKYEADTLIVFYTDEKDIPANPREPNDPYTGSQATDNRTFGAPDPKFAARARQRNAARPQPYYSQQQTNAPPVPTPTFDLSQWMARQQQQPQVNQPPAPQQQVNAPVDLTSLLASLQPKLSNQPQQHPQAPPMMNFGGPAQPPPSMMVPQPAPQIPNGQPDLTAILAALNQHGAAAQAPQMGGFGAPPMMGFAPQTQQQTETAAEREQRRWRDQGDKNKFFKTKVCRYWQEGRCMKGDGCTYLHEEPAA